MKKINYKSKFDVSVIYLKLIFIKVFDRVNEYMAIRIIIDVRM